MPTLSIEAQRAQVRSRKQWLASAAFALLSLVYLAQCASPLRLINDGVDYLLQASSALDGHGFLIHGVRSMRPAGYPALIYGLAKLGLGTSWAIVGLNCLLLAIGCWASYHILRRSFEFSAKTAQIICILTLLSFVMVRNVAYPLSDVSYFGLSAPCAWMLLIAEFKAGGQRWRWFIAAVPLILVCIAVRTIGIVLIPAFFWAAIGGMEGAKKIYPVLRRYRFLLAAVVVVLFVLGGILLVHSRYWQFNAHIFFHRGIIRSALSNLQDHTSEFGEMLLNVPLSRLPSALVWPARILGGAAMLVFFLGLWTRRGHIDSLLWSVVFGSCIVLGYPWFDTRLWLPFLPFLMGYTLLGFRRIFSSHVLHPAMFAYVCWFCLLGIAALAFSTRLTFAGPRFPDLYGDGNYRATYKFALFGEQPTGNAKVDPDALYLLQRFEPRARK